MNLGSSPALVEASVSLAVLAGASTGTTAQVLPPPGPWQRGLGCPLGLPGARGDWLLASLFPVSRAGVAVQRSASPRHGSPGTAGPRDRDSPASCFLNC